VANNFNYDPTKGDLLVDYFVRSSSVPFATYFEATPFGTQDATTRIFNFSVDDTSGYVGVFGDDTRPYGLVTQFAFVPDQDYYRFDMKAGESATIGVASPQGGPAHVELFNSAGNPLALGLWRDQPGRVISNFVATAAGAYYVGSPAAAPHGLQPGRHPQRRLRYRVQRLDRHGSGPHQPRGRRAAAGPRGHRTDRQVRRLRD